VLFRHAQNVQISRAINRINTARNACACHKLKNIHPFGQKKNQIGWLKKNKLSNHYPNQIGLLEFYSHLPALSSSKPK